MVAVLVANEFPRSGIIAKSTRFDHGNARVIKQNMQCFALFGWIAYAIVLAVDLEDAKVEPVGLTYRRLAGSVLSFGNFADALTLGVIGVVGSLRRACLDGLARGRL